jgi:endonuclease/exonuclease/phosphatase family metal-dependent hydrolase
MNGWQCCFHAAAAAVLSVAGGVAAGAEPVPVRVMSFNIRYGTASDGENHWNLRKEFLVETIQAFRPDLLGTQETLGFQRDFLATQLPGYAVWAAGRDDGREAGEMMALYYRSDRFERLDAGHFWLSTTPDVAGSKSWDSSLPRMVSWVRLRDRSGGQPALTFLNTHFDHRGPEARLESARLLRRKAAELADGGPLIVTGDFNSGEGSPPYQALFAAGDPPDLLVDCFRQAHPERSGAEGTFSGFRADSTGGARIDWIGVSRHWRVLEAGIDRTARDGRTPSDHFPVTAVLLPSG